MRPTIKPMDALRPRLSIGKIAILVAAGILGLLLAAFGIALHWALGALLARGLGLA